MPGEEERHETSLYPLAGGSFLSLPDPGLLRQLWYVEQTGLAKAGPVLFSVGVQSPEPVPVMRNARVAPFGEARHPVKPGATDARVTRDWFGQNVKI
jgi:hypothetical protein